MFFKFDYGYCDDFTSLREITDPYKPWIVEFNQPYDHEHLMKQAESNGSPIYVGFTEEGKDTRYMNVNFHQESDTKLKVTPQIGYLYNNEYSLIINGYGIKNINGDYLNKFIELPFKLIGGKDPVSFEDGVLEDIVRNTIDKKSGPIYKEDLVNIRYIEDNSTKGVIHSLKGIENLPFLESLVIDTSKVRNISPLFELKNLQYLRINFNFLNDQRQILDLKYLNSLHLTNILPQDDLSFLGELHTLKKLAFSYSDINDYSFLYPLQNLNSLSIYRNEIKDISFVANLPNLEYLNLSYNVIEDITPISSLTNLKELYLNNNIISSLAPLSGLTKLETLEADYNFIETLEGLETCKELQVISLWENNIKDISPLSNLHNIQILYLGNNIISDISILEDLEILFDVYLYGNPITSDISLIIDNGTLSRDFLSLDKIQEAGIKAHQIIDEIIEEGMTDLEKEEAIYRYLIDNIQYDFQQYREDTPTKEDPGNIYGALVHGWAICDGYAHAMKVLGRLAGLDCIYIMGEVINSDLHAWNMINLDGKYYHLDATWDDGGNNLPTDYDFFNISDINMMYLGGRIWDADYPRTEEIDDNYINYCDDNNISIDDFYLISGNVHLNPPINTATPILLNLNILDESNDIKYTAFSHMIMRGGLMNIPYAFKVPNNPNFSSYIIDYNLYYINEDYSNHNLLRLGYGSKDGISPYKHRQDIFALDESTDVNILNYDIFDLYIDDYKIDYYLDSPLGDSFPYLITNVNDIILPPYSAILYSVDHHVQDSMNYNTQGFGDILVSNHTGENKMFKAGEILTGPYNVLNDMSIYYSIIVFDSDFDEEDLRIKGTIDMDNVIYGGRWIYGGFVPDRDTEVNPPTDDPIIDIENTMIHNGNQKNVGYAIEKDGYYYFTETIDGYISRLVKVSIDTGEKYSIYDGIAYYLQISGNHLYFSSSQKGLLRINLDTNVLDTVVDINRFQDGFSNWYYINDGSIYYNSRTSQNLFRIDIDTLDVNIVSENKFNYLNVVGDYIYYTNGNKRINISRYNLLTGEDKILSEVQASNLISDGKYLYYLLYEFIEEIDDYRYSIYKADMNGRNAVSIYQTKSSQIANINIDDYGNVYVSIYDDGVYKISLNNSTVPLLEKVSNNPYISYIIIGEKYIYLLDYTSNEPEIINHGE